MGVMGSAGMARSTPAAEAESLTLFSISAAGIPKQLGLVTDHTSRDEAQILLVPAFPAPQLLLKAALLPVPGEPIPHLHLFWLAKVRAWGPVLSGLRAPHLDGVHPRRCADSWQQFCGRLQVPICSECFPEHGVHCAQWFSRCWFFILFCFSFVNIIVPQGWSVQIPTAQTAPILDQLATAPDPNPSSCLQFTIES